MIYANCGSIAVTASSTYTTIVELLDKYPAPFPPEMMMIFIDHNSNICNYIERHNIINGNRKKLTLEGNRFWSRSIITTILLPFLTW